MQSWLGTISVLQFKREVLFLPEVKSDYGHIYEFVCRSDRHCNTPTGLLRSSRCFDRARHRAMVLKMRGRLSALEQRFNELNTRGF